MKKLTKITLVSALMLLSSFMFAQSTVSGTVTDADMNAPLPGANVVEKGTTNGTTTDFDGNFTLTTSSNSGELVISYVGYASKSIAFSGSTTIGSVALASDNSLQEIVLIGTGVVDLAEDRKTPVAVSTVKAAEIQARVTGNVEFAEVLKNTPSVYVSNQAGGFGDGVSSWLLENNFKGKLKRIGLPDSFVQHGSRNEVLNALKPILEELSNQKGITVLLEKNSVLLNAENINAVKKMAGYINPL